MTELSKWFALLTRSNFEKTVFTSIVRKQYEAFLPTTKRKSRRKDRNLMIDVPLFSGYVFVKTSLDAPDHLNILKTPGAVRLLGNQSEPVPVPESQIESLKILTRVNMDLITGKNIQLKKGDAVMILEGPLAGVKGEFTHYRGRGRLVIKIDLLGQYVGVDLDEDIIEKVAY